MNPIGNAKFFLNLKFFPFLMAKLTLEEAGAQIARMPWAELVGTAFTYGGVPVFPRIQREKPTVYQEGTGAEISAILLGQEDR